MGSRWAERGVLPGAGVGDRRRAQGSQVSGLAAFEGDTVLSWCLCCHLPALLPGALVPGSGPPWRSCSLLGPAGIPVPRPRPLRERLVPQASRQRSGSGLPQLEPGPHPPLGLHRHHFVPSSMSGSSTTTDQAPGLRSDSLRLTQRSHYGCSTWDLCGVPLGTDHPVLVCTNLSCF